MGKGAKTKGYIKNLKTGTTKKFLFNPNTVTYNRQSSVKALDSPGVNYPVLAYGSTGERSVEVSLFLYGSSTPEYISFLEGLQPSTTKKNTSGVTHPLALFVVGKKVRKVVVTDVSVEETRWDKKLSCTEATVKLKMVEVCN
nr:MAG TPA: Pvc1, Pvc9, Pvc11, Pvc12, Pvc4, Photorhabdus asymbiotica, PVC, contractile.5A [Caudoviricetes sp.]